MPYDLEFEKPLAELEKRILALQRKGEHLKPDEREQLHKAEQDLPRLTADIYDHLTTWQTVQVARHANRPHTVDYLRLICDDFFELHGDRASGDNPTIMGGPARIGSRTVMVMGHEKGRTIKEQQRHNAGMTRPDGFRKAQRLMHQAEKLDLPVLCLIDTPGAAITIEDEKSGQGRAIAAAIYQMTRHRTPIVAVVLGEGGSGGALALGVADRVLALKYTYYAVASPESAALITWRDIKHAPLMAEGQKINANHLYEMGLIDELLPEPLGGAHQDHQAAATTLKEAVNRHLDALQQLPVETLLEQRYQKYRAIGPFNRQPVAED